MCTRLHEVSVKGHDTSCDFLFSCKSVLSFDMFLVLINLLLNVCALSIWLAIIYIFSTVSNKSHRDTVCSIWDDDRMIRSHISMPQ